MEKVLFLIKTHLKSVISAVIVVLVIPAILFAVIGKKDNNNDTIVNQTKEVGVITVAESAILKQNIKYPGLVISDQEVKIVSKGSGIISSLNFMVGDSIATDQVLARIDSVDANPAKASYANVLTAINNALVTKQDISKTFQESLKSAQISYETAKLAVAQAESALANKGEIFNQADSDVKNNADVSIDRIVEEDANTIEGINNLTGFNENNLVHINYSSNLGVLNTQSLNNTKYAFTQASDELKHYRSLSFANVDDKLKAATTLTDKVQKLANATQTLFQNSVTDLNLSQASLSTMQGTVSGYQSKTSANISQLNSVKQSLQNTGLNNNSNLSDLQKAYEIAKQQEAAAGQNLNNLIAGNQAQLNSAQGQINTLSGQANLARIQVDNLTIKAPIAGKITQKMISAGDTVNAGQVVAVMSQTAKLKIQTYVDQVYVNSLLVGMPLTVSDNNGNSYKASIISVSPAADAVTKRFLVEATFDDETVDSALNPGIVISVSIDMMKVSEKPGSIFLPITAVNVGQTENYIFLLDNGIVKKQLVNIIEVSGENAEIASLNELAPDAKIIISGNRLIKEGDSAIIKDQTKQ